MTTDLRVAGAVAVVPLLHVSLLPAIGTFLGQARICKSRKERHRHRAKQMRVIRLQVPIDLTTVRETASSVFSAITPMRIDALMALAVLASLGPRAPADKRARCLRSNLEALANGSFVVDIDGRVFCRPDDVVACESSVTLRFFSSSDRSQPLRHDDWPQGTRPPGIT